jgi:hypothetical protein
MELLHRLRMEENCRSYRITELRRIKRKKEKRIVDG